LWLKHLLLFYSVSVTRCCVLLVAYTLMLFDRCSVPPHWQWIGFTRTRQAFELFLISRDAQGSQAERRSSSMPNITLRLGDCRCRLYTCILSHQCMYMVRECRITPVETIMQYDRVIGLSLWPTLPRILLNIELSLQQRRKQLMIKR